MSLDYRKLKIHELVYLTADRDRDLLRDTGSPPGQ